MNRLMRKKAIGLFTCLLIGLFVSSVASTAQAGTVCVSSASDLQIALASAATNGEDDVIHIEQGTYYGNFIYASTEPHGVTIEGGYLPGCTSRVVDRTNTVLDADRKSKDRGECELKHPTEASA